MGKTKTLTQLEESLMVLDLVMRGIAKGTLDYPAVWNCTEESEKPYLKDMAIKNIMFAMNNILEHENVDSWFKSTLILSKEDLERQCGSSGLP